MEIAEQLFKEIRTLPESDVRQVLDFVGYLKARRATSDKTTPTIESEDEAADWAEFEQLAGVWSGKFNRDECYDRKVLR